MSSSNVSDNVEVSNPWRSAREKFGNRRSSSSSASNDDNTRVFEYRFKILSIQLNQSDNDRNRDTYFILFNPKILDNKRLCARYKNFLINLEFNPSYANVLIHSMNEDDKSVVSLDNYVDGIPTTYTLKLHLTNSQSVNKYCFNDRCKFSGCAFKHLKEKDSSGILAYSRVVKNAKNHNNKSNKTSSVLDLCEEICNSGTNEPETIEEKTLHIETTNITSTETAQSLLDILKSPTYKKSSSTVSNWADAEDD